jgi:tight adherence protein C
MEKRLEHYIGQAKESDKTNKRIKELSLKNKIGYFREKGTDYIRKKISSDKEDKLEKSLQQMGNPWGITSAEFQLYLTILKIALPLSFGVFGKIIGLKLGSLILITAAGAIAGIAIPNVYIKRKIKERHEKGLKELPDFIDLLTVSLEAGLGFDSALNKVVAKNNGVLSAEFHLCLEKMRFGKPRKEVFTELKDRLNFDSLVSLINSILQAEKLGMSMVQIFRIKSQEERAKRKQRAEEAAMKVPIKILFPLVFFIFPSMFIILLAPAVLSLISNLG